MKLIAILTLCASGAWASTLGQQTITLAGSGTPLACGSQRYVNKLTVRVIPGFVGKVFVGTAGMDTNSYANTLAILFPNLGAHSEEYVVQDPSGDDGIDLCSIFIAGEVPGENAIAEYISNGDGVTAPQNLLVPTLTGIPPMYSVNQLGEYTILRLQSIPGVPFPTQFSADGGTDLGIFLAPNFGDITQHNGWSEKWEQSDPFGSNGLVASMGIFSMVSSSQIVLISGWQKETQAGMLVPPIEIFSWISGTASFGTLASAITPYFSQMNLRIHKTSGAVFNGKDEIDDIQGNPVGLLFPNTSLTGWSESIDFGSGLTGILFAVTNSGNVDQISYDALFYDDGPTNTLPPALTTITSQIGGYITGGSAVSRGYVKRLRVQVVPGGAGLVFLGTSSMNTATLDGVYAILYPNSVGRWSETFEVDDPEGDGISTDDLYVQTEVPGEQVIVSTITTGITPPDGVLSVKMSGALSGNFGTTSVPFVTSSTPVAMLRAQAVPGGYEKLWVGTAGMTAEQPDPSYANVLKVLWPSQGNFDVGEGHSERFVQSCDLQPASAPNCLDLQSFTFWPELPWEQMLVFALGR